MSRRKRNRNSKNPKTRNGNIKRLSRPVAQSCQVTNRGALKSLHLKHREFVTDLVQDDIGGTNQIRRIHIQPGLETTFPWLGQIAQRFETYRFQELRFRFIPSLGTQTNGSIALCPDYDAGDDNTEATKATLLAFEDSVRGPIWAELVLNCSGKNLTKSKEFYTRRGDLGPNLDIKTYDTGALYITLNTSLDEDTVVGELWVEYAITFFTPQLETDPVLSQVVLSDLSSNNLWDTIIHNAGPQIMTAFNESGSGNPNFLITKPGRYQMTTAPVQGLATVRRQCLNLGTLSFV
jgi:hypothetical protein